MGFWVRYFATGGIGTLAIYYGMPLIQPNLATMVQDLREDRIPIVSGHDAQAQMTSSWSFAETTSTAAYTPPMPKEVTQPDVTPAVLPPTESPAAPTPIVVTELDYTPSTQLIKPSGMDITHWGVTIRDAAYFEKDGKRHEVNLPGGTLVEQISLTTSSKGEVALCRIWRGTGWVGPYLVATADLIRFVGGRDEVDAEALDVLCRYYALNARVEARKAELRRKMVDANPHAAPLREAKQRYEEAKERAEMLTQIRDKQQGLVRIKSGDELRRLKEDEPKMRRELETLAQQYEQWKKGNAVETADPTHDPQIQALDEQMQALLPDLKGFGLTTGARTNVTRL